MGKLNEAKNMKPEYQDILEEKKNINDQNKEIFKKVVIENNKDKLVEDNKDLENCKTLGQYKSARDMAAKNRKALQERNEKLKKKFGKFVAASALIVMLTVGARVALRNKQNNTIDNNNQPVYSEKIPGEQVQQSPGEAELETETVKGGGSYKPAESPHDISSESTLKEKGADYTESKTTTGTAKNDVSVQSEESKKDIEQQKQEIEQRKQETGTTVKEHEGGTTTIKVEDKKEVKKNEEKNKVDHSYGEAEEEKGQKVEKVTSEEQKKAANKVTEKAPEKAQEEAQKKPIEASDPELDALEALTRTRSDDGMER